MYAATAYRLCSVCAKTKLQILKAVHAVTAALGTKVLVLHLLSEELFLGGGGGASSVIVLAVQHSGAKSLHSRVNVS